jgi:hypothetical protein
VATVVLLSQLVLWNAWVVRRGDKAVGAENMPHVRPRDIAAIAARGDMAFVRWTGVLHRLRAIPDLTLVLWTGHRDLRFFYERVAGAKVELVDPMWTISPDVIGVLQAQQRIDVVTNLSDGTPLVMVIEEGEHRYVLALSTASDGSAVLLPESLYRQVQRTPSTAQP